MRLQVCGANKFQLDLVRQSDVDVLALRVTTSRAIDLSLRNRWNCFGPRPRPHKQREETHAQYQLGTEAKISMRAANVGMLFYYTITATKVLGGGVRNAKCTSAPGILLAPGDDHIPGVPSPWGVRFPPSNGPQNQALGTLQYSFSWPLILIFLKCTLIEVRKFFVLPDTCYICWLFSSQIMI